MSAEVEDVATTLDAPVRLGEVAPVEGNAEEQLLQASHALIAGKHAHIIRVL